MALIDFSDNAGLWNTDSDTAQQLAVIHIDSTFLDRVAYRLRKLIEQFVILARPNIIVLIAEHGMGAAGRNTFQLRHDERFPSQCCPGNLHSQIGATVEQQGIQGSGVGRGAPVLSGPAPPVLAKPPPGWNRAALGLLLKASTLNQIIMEVNTP